MIIKGSTILRGVGEATDVHFNPEDIFMTGFRIGVFSSAVVIGSLHLAKYICDQAKKDKKDS